MQTVEALRSIVNGDPPDIVLRATDSNIVSNAAEAMERLNCRLFRKYLCYCFLRGANINAVSGGHEES